MMTVHDALEAWQAGEITSHTAMRLTGAVDVLELHAFADQCGVEVRTGLLPREEHQAARATKLIRQLLATQASVAKDVAAE